MAGRNYQLKRKNLILKRKLAEELEKSKKKKI